MRRRESVTGVWRAPDAPGLFTPAPDIAHRIWYARDLAGIAAADHVALAAPGSDRGRRHPQSRRLAQWAARPWSSFRNQHLSYAITWFGLAAGLLGVWISYHISKGRIAFK